jgi:hypothetical protein
LPHLRTFLFGLSGGLFRLSPHTVYVVELKGREFVSERTKRVRALVKALGVENLITKTGWR